MKKIKDEVLEEIITIECDKTQEEYLIQMFEYFFPKHSKKEILCFDENGNLDLDLGDKKIHWSNLTYYILPKKIFDKFYYWENRFYALCLSPSTKRESLHPINFLYEKFLRFKEGKSLSIEGVDFNMGYVLDEPLKKDGKESKVKKEKKNKKDE